MIQTYSKSRQQAEIAFGKAQSQFLARESVLEVPDMQALKTVRLREARLAKELQDSMASTNTAPMKRVKPS